MELKDQILARMYVVITLMALLPVVIGLQVLNVSAIDGSDLREVAEHQSSEYRDIPALRGEILDATGRPLAVNIERVDLALDPMESGFRNVSDRFYATLSEVSGVPEATLRARVRNRTSRQYVMLVRDVQMSGAELAWFASVPGVLPTGTTTRRYNHGTTAAHILGATGTDGGLTGLELSFDEILRGKDGRRLLHKDRRNRVKFMPGNEERPPEHGESLVLTIDLLKQSILEEELARGVEYARPKWAAAVALDPQTGSILAMANWPTFDPNRMGAYPSANRRNHVIADMIEPGSVIKVVPAAAAIERGLVALSDSIDTAEGSLKQGRYTITDTHPNGTLTFADVIKVSSNVGTALVAERMSEGLMYQYARQFGFNQKTGIELPGEADTKLKRTDRWSATDQSAMSRGYALQATPLQIALSYAALANGGVLMKPYLVKERRDAAGRVTWAAEPDSIRRVIDRVTADTLMRAFESVVSEGGTAEQAMIDGLRIAGKTGTARKAGPGGYIPGAYRATFVGLWPVEDPKVVLAIVMDEPERSMYGGVVAAPIFRRVTERWMAHMPEMARYVHRDDHALPPQSPLLVPDVTGMPAPIAGRRLAALGLEPAGKPLDYHTAVQSQNVSPGAMLVDRVAVRLEGALDSLESMPDVTGMSGREARVWLGSLGLEVEAKGHGLVREQWPRPGARLTGQARLTLN
ncbi:MAG: PASTA domain-containing protein [Bacteroidetes bacterium]|nr:PASTA domain-containing protein [Bacteroidota bacterium]